MSSLKQERLGVAAVGIAAYYFKIVRPKKQPKDEEDDDGMDDYDDDEDEYLSRDEEDSDGD